MMRSESITSLEKFHCPLCDDSKSPAWKKAACRKKENSPCMVIFGNRRIQRNVLRKRKKKLIDAKAAEKRGKRGPRLPPIPLSPKQIWAANLLVSLVRPGNTTPPKIGWGGSQPTPSTGPPIRGIDEEEVSNPSTNYKLTFT